MLLLVDTITPRLQYITDFAVRELGTGACILTLSPAEYGNYQGVKINYSSRRLEGDILFLEPHPLLFEKGISQQQITSFDAGGLRAFYQTRGDYPFDIFAASFYLISRYEEYLPHKRDMYGRYAYEQSLAYKEGFLSVPLVNQWFGQFRKFLQTRFPGAAFQPDPFVFLPTYDIDEAYSFRHKGWFRTWGGKMRDIVQGNKEQNELRKAVLKGMIRDPYDSFNEMDMLNTLTSLRPLYFFLVAKQNSRFDRNILPREQALRDLIIRHATKYRIGLHPSWRSGSDPDLIVREKEFLEETADIRVISSRQHFIRFRLPETYRRLCDAGIGEDHSMGYGTINGFRASVCSPYSWYDLIREEQAPLTIYPFCFMDANAYYEQKLTPAQALDEMRHYYKVVREVNGVLVTIWHNTFLGTAERFAGWKEAYAAFVNEVVAYGQ